MTPSSIQLGDIAIDVVLKDIKNVHLNVYPPVGKVRISAPARMSLDTIRVYAISKLGWIRKQQQKIRNQARETPREYLERESHYLWGRRYLLKLVESDDAPMVEIKHRRIVLRVRPGADLEKKQSVMDAWYREQIRKVVPALLAKWEPLMQVKVERFYVRRMKTKWGSSNHRRGTIRLNSDLAKKPIACLEYIVVHEMVHLMEPTHNARFSALMAQYIPNWRYHRDLLNDLPLRHEEWAY